MLSCAIAAQPADTKSNHKSATHAMPHNAFTPDDVKYGPAPLFIPQGAQPAVLEGNPMATTGDYTIRVKMPDGYQIAPYWHPKRENVTVVAGTLNVGMGDKFDESKMKPFATAASRTLIRTCTTTL